MKYNYNGLFKLSDYVNKIPFEIFIFVSLALTFLSVNLNENEEQYMQLAKQFVDPTWIHESQNLTEVAGTRIIYQIVIGYTLKFLSFEVTKLIYSLILIIGFSHCLGKIYKVLSLNNHNFLIHLGLFIFWDQSFFAGSWMLITVEPKGFAYLFVLFSFFFLLTNRFNLALMFLIISAYSHILVGFYSFAYLFLTLILFRKYHQIKLRNLMVYALLYSVLLIPFIIYLNATALDNSIKSYEVSPSWIYTYFRSPHHTALVPSLKYFFKTHFFGIVNAVTGLFAAIIIYSELKKSKNISLINQFVIVSLAGTLLLVTVAFIDKNGYMLKFYLYRINSLSTFFLTLLISVYLFYIVNKDYFKKIQLLTLIIFLSVLFKPIVLNIYLNYTYSKSQTSLNTLSDFIKLNTDSKSLFFDYNEHLSLVRKTERNFFVVYKYIPSQLNKINDWYIRVQEKNEVKNHPLKMKNLVERYDIAYIITPKDKKGWTDYKLIYENDDFLLFETGLKTSYNKE